MGSFPRIVESPGMFWTALDDPIVQGGSAFRRWSKIMSPFAPRKDVLSRSERRLLLSWTSSLLGDGTDPCPRGPRRWRPPGCRRGETLGGQGTGMEEPCEQGPPGEVHDPRE